MSSKLLPPSCIWATLRSAQNEMETLVTSLYVSTTPDDDQNVGANINDGRLTFTPVCVCLSISERRRSPETLLKAVGCGAAADAALALSQEISHFSRDLREEYDLQTGDQRTCRTRQTHLRPYVWLDRGTHQHGPADVIQTTLLHRSPGHLWVRAF